MSSAPSRETRTSGIAARPSIESETRPRRPSVLHGEGREDWSETSRDFALEMRRHYKTTEYKVYPNDGFYVGYAAQRSADAVGRCRLPRPLPALLSLRNTKRAVSSVGQVPSTTSSAFFGQLSAWTALAPPVGPIVARSPSQQSLRLLRTDNAGGATHPFPYLHPVA